jgi:hypothetical protein
MTDKSGQTGAGGWVVRRIKAYTEWRVKCVMVYQEKHIDRDSSKCRGC